MNQRIPINTLNTVNFAAMRVMREAYDDALKQVQVRRGLPTLPADDDTRSKLAQEILALAKHGERDVIRLRDGALTALHIV
jgi:hypothetical protein